MARPAKNYCEYFSHDRDMRNHRKIKAIRTKYGVIGYGVWCMILEYLTGCDGNVFAYSEVEIELMAGDFGVSVTEIRDVVDYCLRLELLFLKDGFINSESLDDRLKSVYEKRTVAKTRSKQQDRCNGKFTSKNTEANGVSVTEMPQSKVNKSKVEESKVNTKESPTGHLDVFNKKNEVKIIKMQKNKDQPEMPLPFSGEEFSNKWDEWLKYRKERKLATYTPTGLKATYTKLKRISLGQIELAMQIIDQSLENGWQGLFPINQNTNATNISNTTGVNQSKPGTSEARIQTAKKW